MMFGGAMVFTIYLFVTLYLVQDDLNKVFWLAVLGHVQIFTIMTGYIALLVKRRIEVSKDGITINDTKQDKS